MWEHRVRFNAGALFEVSDETLSERMMQSQLRVHPKNFVFFILEIPYRTSLLLNGYFLDECLFHIRDVLLLKRLSGVEVVSC